MAIFLTGCTASGKTSLALTVAEACGGEVISVDSMAVYHGMDIGTAKPSREERLRVPHHLIDVVGPDENYSLVDYLRDAAAAEEAITRRGRVPMYVGGTPLYLKALLCGLCDAPSEDAAFRREMQLLAEREPPGTLHRRLVDVDPLTAARLHPNDTRRIIRALEVFTQTGIPLASQQTHFDQPQRHEPVFVLAWSPQQIADRIAQRTRLLLDHGWLEEARTLRKSADTNGRPLSRTALQAVGYRELFAVLDGTMSLDAATERIIIRTRQLAKRQRTWFRSLTGTRILDAETMTQEAMMATLVTHAARCH